MGWQGLHSVQKWGFKKKKVVHCAREIACFLIYANELFWGVIGVIGKDECKSYDVSILIFKFLY